MLETLKKEWQAQVAVIILALLTIWWFVSPQFSVSGKRFFGDFPSIYFLMALWGAICGLWISRRWGGMKSIVGKSLVFFSLGLLAQVFGQIVYAIYSFYFNVSVPYPSLGDLGYFGSIPLYVLAVIYLGQASGVKFGLRSFFTKWQSIVVPLVLLSIGYFLFLKGYSFDWSNPLKVFLDNGYPIGQAIYISLTILVFLLSKGVLGGVMKNRVLFILFALFLQFLSDYTFLYQSSRGIWSAGGMNDFMYLVAYFAMTLGLIQFKTVLSHME